MLGFGKPQVVGAALWSKVFYSVAQGRARHGGGVFVEKLGKEAVVDAFAYFAEHPADGFLYEVVFVVQKLFGNYKRLVCPALLYVLKGCQHGDAPVPEQA